MGSSVLEFDRNPTLSDVERLQSFMESVQRAFNEFEITMDDLELEKHPLMVSITKDNKDYRIMFKDYAEFKVVTANAMEAIKGDFKILYAEMLEADEIVVETLKAEYAKADEAVINKLSGDLADYQIVMADRLLAINGKFENLDAEYARIDQTNIKQAWVIDLLVTGEFLADDFNAATGSFSKWLTGVNIVGDNIKAGTISTDRLIIRNPDTNTGILYEINNGAVNQTGLSEEELKRLCLDGKILVAESVTADKINVTDLFAQDITSTGDFNMGGKGALVYNAEDDTLTMRAAEILLASGLTVEDAISEEVLTASAQILQTSEEITLGILAGYTTASDLEAYKKEVENLFKANEEGFSFEFSQLEEKLNAVGDEVTEQKQYIRLIEGEIHIGKSDNPITSVYTNDALEFRYNGQMVARFTNEVLEVRNISAENQVAFFDQWAIRRGAYINGVGYNLNDMWIGG